MRALQSELLYASLERKCEQRDKEAQHKETAKQAQVSEARRGHLSAVGCLFARCFVSLEFGAHSNEKVEFAVRANANSRRLKANQNQTTFLRRFRVCERRNVLTLQVAFICCRFYASSFTLLHLRSIISSGDLLSRFAFACFGRSAGESQVRFAATPESRFQVRTWLQQQATKS